MDNLVISAEVIVPVMILMAIGILLRRFHVVDQHTTQQMNKLIFYGFIPAMMFRSLYYADINSLGNWKLIVFVAATSALSYIIFLIVVPRLEPVAAKRGVIIQGICRGNLPMFGAPIALALVGEISSPIVSLAILAQVPFNSILSILSFELFRPGRGKISAKRIIKSIVTNPIILGLVAGLIFPLFNIKLPDIILSPIDSLGKMASTLAFVVLGATIDFTSSKANRKPVTFTVLMRLVIVPLIWMGLAYLLGFRGAEFVVLTMLFATPTAVSSLPMAVSMDGDGQLASEVIAVGSVLSLVTLFLFIFAIKSLGIA